MATQWIIPWLFVALVAVERWQVDVGTLRARTLLAVAVVVFAVAMWRRRADLIEIRTPRRLLAVAASLAALAILQLGSAQALDPYAASERVLALLVGWSFCLLLPLRAEHVGVAAHELSPLTRTVERRWLVALTAFSIIALASFHYLIDNRGAIVIDETLYILQSRLFGQPGFARPLPSELQPFLGMQYTFVREGGMRTHYPPGWPALLALFAVMRLRWWAPVICGVAATVFTFVLGRRVGQARAALVAAALLATHPWFVTMGAMYYPHGATTACVAAAAWLLVRSEDTAVGARPAHWYAAGALLGVAFAIRPLTGASLGITLLLWLVARGRFERRRLGAMVLFSGLGGFLPLVAVLWYNSVTTGNPLEFGYHAAHGSLHDLGFGLRGDVIYDNLGQPDATRATLQFTFKTAVQQQLSRAWDVGTELLPTFFALPLLVIAFARGYRCRLAVVAPFLVLPVAHFFYWGSDTRFYIEMLPFAFVGIASVLTYLWRQEPRLQRPLLVFLLGGNLVASLVSLQHWRIESESRRAYAAQIQTRARQGKVLVLVSPPEEHALLASLYYFNVDRFPGDVVVARDLGVRDSLLLRRFPDRAVMRAVWVDPWGRHPRATP